MTAEHHVERRELNARARALLTEDGTLHGPELRRHIEVRVDSGRQWAGASFTTSSDVRNSSQVRITVGAVVAETKSPGELLLLDGSLQGSLRSPQWTYAGHLGALTMFTNHDAAGLAWLQPLSVKAPQAALHAPGSVTTTVTSSGVETMVANTETSAILVRSVDFQQGWTADLTPLGGGPVRAAPVTSLGLVKESNCRPEAIE